MKISINPRFIFILFTLVCPFTHAQDVNEQVADWMTEGWRKNVLIDFVKKPPSDPSALASADSTFIANRTKIREVIQLVDLRFETPGTRAAILSQNRKIIFERYLAGKADYKSTPIGNSISKSLVALAVGKALCDGSIKSLDDKASAYLESLNGTSWGNASIRQLLMMSSGAFRTSPINPTGWKDQQDSLDNRAIYFRDMRTSYLNSMRRLDDFASRPGAEFHYNNYDTLALNLLIEQATKKKFAKYFEQTIWAEINPESDGAWIKNSRDQIAGYFGFSARPRDWLRIGHYVLDQLKQNNCFSSYLQEATKHQINANWITMKSYGYQIWTNCTNKAGSFCFLGVHGQQLIIHPQSETALYVHGTHNNIISSWRYIFDIY